MDPITLAFIALGGFAFLGGKRSGSAVRQGGNATMGNAERGAMLNEIRSMSHHYSNKFGSMPLLADYLTVIGFRESNFNPASTNPGVKTNPENAARGLFGMRPRTAFKTKNGLEHLLPYPNTLLNPRWAFVTAVDHVWRACDAMDRKSGASADYAAVRRWWGTPHLVHDRDISDSRSKSSLAKLEKAITDCNNGYGTNIDPDFIWRPIQGWRNYPGMDVMRQVYGLAGNA